MCEKAAEAIVSTLALWAVPFDYKHDKLSCFAAVLSSGMRSGLMGSVVGPSDIDRGEGGTKVKQKK